MQEIVPLRFGTVNCFGIIENGSAILVDTGPEPIRESLLARISDWNVRLIALTHGHFDHSANAAFLAEKLNVPIAIHKEDYRLSQDNRLRSFESRGIIGGFIKSSSLRIIHKIKLDPFEPDFFLEDGQDLSEYGVHVQVIALPGHTAGSVGFLCGGAQACIVGDTMMNLFGVSGARIAEDYGRADKSLLRLKSCEAKLFYPGHGAAISMEKLDRL